MTAPLRKFLLARRLLRQRWGIMIQRQPICVRCKAPLARVHPVESMMAMAVLTVIILGPSFWIFAHLEPYKARK